jgi:hypothetical protein
MKYMPDLRGLIQNPVRPEVSKGERNFESLAQQVNLPKSRSCFDTSARTAFREIPTTTFGVI